MFKSSKIESTVKPEKFVSLNNGVWYYNYNIVEKNIPDVDKITGEKIEETHYEFLQVRINGKPTLSKCYSAILAQYKNEDGSTLEEVIASPAKNMESEELANSIYESIEIDFGIKPKPTDLEVEKEKVIKAINNYDVSLEVNSFFLNGLQVWLDKSTRVGLMNSLNIEKASGKETSTLWFGNIKLDINTEAAIQMLSALELYALECYNKTAEHKVNIENMESIEDITAYDYTEGYPTKLNFTV